MPFRSTGRSIGQRSYFSPLSPPIDRLGRPRLIQRAELSGGRPAQSTEAIFREQSSLDGRPTRSTGPPAQAGVHACARRSTAPVDRLLLRSTGLVDRQTASCLVGDFFFPRKNFLELNKKLQRIKSPITREGRCLDLNLPFV